jgi:hypothetical protein
MALVKLAWNGQALAGLGVDPTSDYPASAPDHLPLEPVRLTLTSTSP